MMNHANFHLSVKDLSESGQISGVAAGYGNTDAHGDVFAAGAFNKALISMRSGGRSPAMLLHHDPRRPAGRWDKFTETAAGMEVAGSLALDAADGREAYALLKAGALTGLSVGFRTIADKAGVKGGRVITEAELFEVSLVTVPSNPITRINGVKDFGGVRDLEELLREQGFSGRVAKRMATAAMRAADSASIPEINENTIRSLTESTAFLSRYAKETTR